MFLIYIFIEIEFLIHLLNLYHGTGPRYLNCAHHISRFYKI